jgi:hypothetical protein
MTTTTHVFGTNLHILGYDITSITLYFCLIIGYMIIVASTHKLRTNSVQLHREALMQVASARKIGTIAGYNIAQTTIHIVSVLFIASNNSGFLVASVVAHCVGVVLVFRTQRQDNSHTIRKLAHAIRNISDADVRTKKDLQFIIRTLQENKTKF